MVFFLAADPPVIADGTATFDATLGDQDLIGGPIGTGGLAFGYNMFSDLLTYDGVGSDLVFTANANSGDFYVDDVSTDVVGVPEPMSIAMLASAVGALGLVRRRRA